LGKPHCLGPLCPHPSFSFLPGFDTSFVSVQARSRYLSLSSPLVLASFIVLRLGTGLHPGPVVSETTRTMYTSFAITAFLTTLMLLTTSSMVSCPRASVLPCLIAYSSTYRRHKRGAALCIGRWHLARRIDHVHNMPSLKIRVFN
jgi:hypothetical protein